MKTRIGHAHGRRLLSLLLALVICFGAIGLGTLTASAANRTGDTDGDGKVTAKDARFVLRLSARLETATAVQKAAAEVDGDGKVTAKDARIILRVSARLATFWTKGSFNGKEYVNTWADLRIPLPTGWRNKSASEYAAYESDGAKCDFACIAPNEDSLVVMFVESNGSAKATDLLEYYDEYTRSSQQGLKSLKHYDATLNGYSYVCSDYVFEQGGVGYAESIYVRLLDNRFIVLIVVGDTIADNDAIMRTIRKAN